MKKILSLALLCGLMIGFVACNKENEPKEEANVAVELTLPQQRANGDGLTALKVDWYIYKSGATAAYKKGTADFTGTPHKATVNVSLAAGQEYEFVYFAHADGAPYTYTEADFTVTSTNTAANDEKGDCFANYAKLTITEANFTINAELKRIVAQLNVLTEKADYEECTFTGDYATDHPTEAAYYVPTTIKMTTNVYPKYDIKNNVATGTAADVTFTGLVANVLGETHPALGANYKWMGSCYFFTTDRTNNEAAIEIYDGTPGNKTRSISAANVPVETNKRTNIYGKLLMSNGTINITKDPVWASDNNENTPSHNDNLGIN